MYHPTIPYQRGVPKIVLKTYHRDEEPTQTVRVYGPPRSVGRGGRIGRGDFGRPAIFRPTVSGPPSGDGASFPVGQGKLPVYDPRTVFPPVRTADLGGATTQGATLPPAIDRRDTPPNATVLPTSGVPQMQVTDDWFVFHDLKARGLPVKHRGSGTIANPSAQAPTAPIVSTKPSGGSMDLGQLITDLGTSYIQTKYAQAPTVQPVYDSPFIPNVVEQAAPWFQLEDGTIVEGKKPCKRRRRRRRLATASDLRDLAALQGILGNGKNFQVWIATHSR